MSERSWFRSLYWRIALGIIVLLTAVLAVQALVFVWFLSSRPERLPPRALQQTARVFALELEAALAQDPETDLDRFVRDRANALSRPIVLVWLDGRVIHAGVDDLPEWLVDAARARLGRPIVERPRGARSGADRSPDGTPLPRAGPRPGDPPAGPGPSLAARRRSFGFAPVQMDGVIVGALTVLPGPPIGVLAREFGPMLLAVVSALTIGGTAVAALLIFGPAHRRLRGLEAAARQLGAGEAGARAPDSGGDEIATVARSFNTMAAEITQRAEALQAADRTRRQLLADVSHELMTPLTAMRGYLETLRLPDLPLDSAARERYLGIVLEETLRLEHIIGDLVDLARLEAGGPAFTIAEVRVADLFDRVRSRHERRLIEQQVTLEIRIAPGAERLAGDGDRLEQALQNLAANALRHAPPGGRLTLAATVLDEDRVVLAVSDTGRGIPSEHLPYIFDRFYKADAARASAGSGLGLSIVRAIAERHGGTVRVRSTPNVETTFEIVLPRSARPVAALRGA